ncbi:hypothetical protein P9578_28390 [Brevibacillus choshinensis]|uniref:hypothetical protein n=1 Tax=Brevibacillus choshinensis TaxID=54911 RepID=UPI002E20EAC4|nr:hypothetical protein [Brevibacillus choshinensis]
MRPEDLLSIFQDSNEQSSPFRLGKISATYTSGRPPVLFDGETTASTRIYPYLASYTPVANERVLLGKVGNGWVVLGKVI